MPRSKARLLELEAERGERLAARDLADIAAADPFLRPAFRSSAPTTLRGRTFA